MWRSFVRKAKVAASSQSLEKHLFILNGVFRKSLLQVRELCSGFAEGEDCQRLCSLTAGKVYRLDEFVSAQEDQANEVVAVLKDFHADSLGSVAEACASTLSALEQRLFGDADDAEADDANETADPESGKVSYTVLAQRRAEHRKLHSFIKLADYMIRDNLHRLVVDSVRHLLDFVSLPRQLDDLEAMADALEADEPEEDEEDEGLEEEANEEEGVESPLFEIETQDDDEALTFLPSAHDIQSETDKLLASFTITVSSVPDLSSEKSLRQYTELVETDEPNEDALAEMVAGDPQFADLVASVRQTLAETFELADECKDVLMPLADDVKEFRSLDIEEVKNEAKSGGKSLEDFEEDIEFFNAQLRKIQKLPLNVRLGLTMINNENLRNKFLPAPAKCLGEIEELLPVLGNEKVQSLLEEINDANTQLNKTPPDVDEFCVYLEFLETLESRQDDIKELVEQAEEHYDLMDKHNVFVPPDQRANFQALSAEYPNMKTWLSERQSRKDEDIAQYTVMLEASIKMLHEDRKVAGNQAMDEVFLEYTPEGMNPDSEVMKRLTELDQTAEDMKATADKVQRQQKLFNKHDTNSSGVVERFEEMKDVVDDIRLKKKMWDSLRDFKALTEQWTKTQFNSLDAEEMSNEITATNKIVMNAERTLPTNNVVPVLKEMVTTFKNTVPVVNDLRNDALMDRHWEKIEAVIGQPVPRQNPEEFTFNTLLELKVMLFKDQLAVISTEATQEQILEQMLQKVSDSWAETEFVLNPYKEQKDVYALAGIDDITVQLEDSLVTMGTITASRFVGGIRDKVEVLEEGLNMFSETLDEALLLQRNWMYLESIFCAQDIQRQLPAESKQFFDVDAIWKGTLKTLKDTGNAYKSFTHPGLLDTLQKAGAILDKVQNSLEDYLEKKRMAFPRFYFLSNDELLEIMAQTRDPKAVQPHMGKCFDAIKSLDFGGGAGRPETQDNRIYGMFSPEGELVDYAPNTKARGNVETWLTGVEAEMRLSLKGLTKAATIAYPEKPRQEWIFDHVCQVVLTVASIYWAKEVLAAFGEEDPMSAMKENVERSKLQLHDLTLLVRGDLTSLQRKTVSTLIVLDVHARDTLELFVEDEILKESEFGWQMQLRFYWDEDEGTCAVRQTNAHFWYGYEYLGAQMRLVITGMTDRCYMTLTGALHLKLGGAPAGPAGTGKTETTKDLAKGIGIQCVVFNCGDNLDQHFMGKFFKGLCQCGAWACFDEFNRIGIEVLSVVAQQMISIQNALRAIPAGTTNSTFSFEGSHPTLRCCIFACTVLTIALAAGKTIKIFETFGAFITMNPGYAGRTELPDNLKVLFRPVSMMIPNYTMVAEVMLFSEGFGNAKILSVKFIKLYKLSSEQLSQQKHYDFGMRAVKSVLVMAGSLLRANPDLKEDITLIRALRDSNIPKFLKDDVILFQALLSDLFPGEVIPDNDYGELLAAVEEVTLESGLQVTNACTLKAIQLYETLNVRFGVMLVGPTGGGKTSCYKTLQSAMTRLRENGSDNPEMEVVHTYVLNPKSISMGELYGEFNDMTGEWKDGLGSGIMRDATAAQDNDRKWVVFDGPVDAIWIENMNTVLDDNRTLCLPNGERIKLNGVTMRTLFEVQDLEVASPATVSRCGMVWLEPAELGWRPYVQTWMAGLHDQFTEDQKANLWKLFDDHVDSGIKFYRRNCLEFIPTVDINLVTSVCCIFQSLTDPELNGKGIPWDDVEEADKILGMTFAFAYAWGIGGNTNQDGLEKFDEFIHEELEDSVRIPGSSLYDVFVQISDGSMEPWKKNVPEFEYKPGASFFSMLVPTEDTVRFSFVMDICLDLGKSVLYTGPSGVGKSVVALDLFARIEEPKRTVMLPVGFSAQTSSPQTQETIEAKLEKRRKTIFGAPPGKKMILFVDDVNMPAREEYGAQPPVELLRQFQDFRGLYDREKWFWKDIVDVTLVSACAPPGGGRMPLTPRFVRHFTMLSLPPASDDVLKAMFQAIVGGFLSHEFPQEVAALAKPIVKGTVEVYNRIAADLLPIPAKSHYTFNLRDISKAVQGILMIKPQNCGSANTMTRLWVHECMRVFHDRLIDDEDQKYFKELLLEIVQSAFSMSWDFDETFVDSTIIFGDYLKMGATGEDRVYEEVTDLAALNQLLDEYLFEYNMTNPVQMNLVFFRAAVEHISRVARMCRLDKGNAMLVGVGGSGKQSCTRLATAMCEYKCFTIELKKGYDIVSFRDDIKNLFELTGVEGKPVTFLLVDTQIVVESMLEDVNNILNSGEVPGMYADDEKAKIISDMRPVCEALGIPATKDKCWSTFIARCQSNLHIVLCMSPVGESFRRRCKLFPSLINCTTIDWFTPWPDDALLAVATKLFEPTDLGDVKSAVADMCVKVHQSTQAIAAEFLSELNRNYYITPKSYLDLVGLYIEMLKEKRGQKQQARERLLNGLSKLHECNKLVADMEEQLTAMAPVLKEKSEATAKLLEVVAVDQAEAEKIEVVVNKEAGEAKIKAAEVKEIKDDAQADLDKAMPALQAAVDALNSLNKGDITEIKSFAKPPEKVQMTLEAVCILFGEKPDWDTAKKLMNDANFLQSLFDFDKDAIPEARLKKLKKYTTNEEFTPELVGKVSKAAKSLCMWCYAMDVYSEVAKAVEPKKKALHEAQATLDEVMSALKVKEDMLAEVQAKVAQLQKTLKEAQDESQRLQDEAALTEARLARAGKLTGALGDEAERWTTETGELADQIELLVGDVFLSSACISYFGAFDSAYRSRITGEWLEGCKDSSIPCTDVFSLAKIMGDPVQIRQWNVEALPTDDLSVENGILVTRAKRWPLMIDPQEQANKWVKNMEARNGLRMIKLSDGNFLRTLEGAIRIGSPVICEDLGEDIDPALEPVLLKAVVQQGGRQILRLGETDVDYDENFRFYMTSKLPNPHYLPELCIKVTLINFTVTITGLEDQLLGDVVAQERPDLEETKNKLVISMASDAKQLKDLEDKTLALLQSSEGNILDNEPLINTLNNSKLTSGVIQGRVADAEKTEISINEAREGYRTVATRGSLLYFVIADLGLLDPMYQYSLEYFKQLFNYCIEVSEKSDDLATRLQTVIDYVTYFVYLTVCRGLFERHRLIYSFLICTSVMRNAGKIAFDAWNFLLRGAGAMTVGAGPNPDDSWITAGGWDLLNALETLVPNEFTGFVEDFQRNIAEWQEWFDDPAPHTIPLPGVWGMVPTEDSPNEQYLGSFMKMLVMKALKPDKLSFAMGNYVAEMLGERFTEVPPLQLQDIFGDTSPTVPTVFVLSTGADPTKMLLDFAEEKGFMSTMSIISLGAGQGPIAENLIAQGVKKGQWVCLQNCHLATSWLPKMEKVIADLADPQVPIHDDFRLWLMSMPSPAFPVATLQSSIKLTNEPPKGLRANMIGTLGVMKEEYFESCSKPQPWKKLMFGLVFFHAMIQERRKFGPLGWNVGYAFNNSDLECSMATLKMFLDEQETIPWESLTYVTGEINYGGRVTDDQDRRCLMCILAQYYTPRIIGDEYRFSESGKYYSPPEGSLEAMIQYTRSLPLEEQPEVFGMHENALTAFNVNETTRVIDTVLSIQPRVSGGSGGDALTPDQMADSVAETFQNEMPADLDPEQCAPGLFDRDPETEQMDSLATVLIQEVDRFNNLLAVLRDSLKELRRAIKGIIVMGLDLEEIYNAFLLNKVPKSWEFAAYPSLKPLSSWWKNLCERMAFMHSWNKNGVPPSVCLPYIFFTQGFLTGALQKHARKHIIPIDSLEFSFIMTTYFDDEELVDGPPEDGMYIRGLFLDAARFDIEKMALEPSELGAPTAPLPYIHILPVEVTPNASLQPPLACWLRSTRCLLGTGLRHPGGGLPVPGLSDSHPCRRADHNGRVVQLRVRHQPADRARTELLRAAGDSWAVRPV